MVSRRSLLIGSAALLASSAEAQQFNWREYFSPTVPLPPYKCIDRGETRIGYPGFEHCRLHPFYQKAFAKWNCHCYTGQCRPTNFRPARVNIYDDQGVETYVQGFEIYISGKFYRIPQSAFRKEKADMPMELLEYEAHVCCSEAEGDQLPHIECAWVNLVG